MEAACRSAPANQARQRLSEVRVFGHGEEGEWWLDLDQVTTRARFLEIGQGSEANNALLSRQVIVVSCHTAFVEEEPPPPFTTETLCDAALAELGIPPGRTMDVANRLYWSGLITWPLTTNPNPGNVEAAWEKISAVGVAWGTRAAPTPRRFPAILEPATSSAIAPTDWGLPVGGTTALDEILYSLIWERALASQMVVSRHLFRDVEVNSAGDERVRFVGSRIDLVEAGWRRFPGRKDWETGKQTNALGDWSPGKMLAVHRIETKGANLKTFSVKSRECLRGNYDLR